MNSQKIKSMCDYMQKAIDVENVEFEFILQKYIEYICLMLENKKFIKLAGIEGVEILKNNIEILCDNLNGELDVVFLKKRRTELWGLSDLSNKNLKKIIRLIITGLGSKEDMLEYSCYPEYLSEDMLGIAIISLHDLDEEIAKDFCIFLKKSVIFRNSVNDLQGRKLN